jgi:hypothetical protein
MECDPAPDHDRLRVMNLTASPEGAARRRPGLSVPPNRTSCGDQLAPAETLRIFPAQLTSTT